MDAGPKVLMGFVLVCININEDRIGVFGSCGFPFAICNKRIDGNVFVPVLRYDLL